MAIRRFICGAVGSLVIAPAAVAQDNFDTLDALEALNESLVEVRDENRSDRILLRPMIDMQPAPSGVDERRAASLLAPGGRGWDAASAWAESSEQQAVIEALLSIGGYDDPLLGKAFAQPYGIEALAAEPDGLDFIAAGLYTELGDPPLIAAAQTDALLGRLDDVICLAHVEATRLADAGEVVKAIEVLMHAGLLGRQMADRPLMAEALWGWRVVSEMLERIRDVVYVDVRGVSPVLTSSDLRPIVALLDADDGRKDFSEAQVPAGDLLAALELIQATFPVRGKPDPDLFGPTMARMAATGFPLRLFGESARWATAAESHANRFDTARRLSALANDMRFRWSRNWHDAALRRPSAYARLQESPEIRAEFSVIAETVPDPEPVFIARQLAYTEARGTQHALAVVAYWLDNNLYPRALAATRPRYLPQLTADPFDPDRDLGREPPFQYFVPMRDQAALFAPNEEITPHEIVIVVPDQANFSIRLRDDQFVVYSVGGDGTPQFAREVENTHNAARGRDYLIWPPVLTFVRDDLVQRQ